MLAAGGRWQDLASDHWRQDLLLAGSKPLFVEQPQPAHLLYPVVHPVKPAQDVAYAVLQPLRNLPFVVEEVPQGVEVVEEPRTGVQEVCWNAVMEADVVQEDEDCAATVGFREAVATGLVRENQEKLFRDLWEETGGDLEAVVEMFL